MKKLKTKNLYKASNVYFDADDCTAYSYNWWCFVRKIKGKVVFNDYNYSVSTNGHQSKVKSLLRELGIKIDLYVETRESLSEFKTAALPSMYRALFQAEIAMSRKGAKQDTIKKCRAQVEDLKSDIKLARSLGAQMKKEDIRELKNRCLDDEKNRLESMRIEREKRRELDKKARQIQKLNQPINLSELIA